MSAAIYGNTIAVGTLNSESVYIFTRNNMTWNQQQRLQPNGASQAFGIAVSLDGDMLAVGASMTNGESGAAYVFTRDGSKWYQLSRITASDAANNDRLGESISISGSIVLVGAWSKQSHIGEAYLYTDFKPEPTQTIPTIQSNQTTQPVQVTQTVEVTRTVQVTQTVSMTQWHESARPTESNNRSMILLAYVASGVCLVFGVVIIILIHVVAKEHRSNPDS